MSKPVVDSGATRADLDRRIGELRPKLHRYCARMTGSVIDGEDVVQEALLKALEASPEAGTIVRPEAWLFRIAHNAALDFLRRRARGELTRSDEDPDMTVDPASPILEREIAAASLRTFMRLPTAQRSSVILMDVLGYSLEEIGAVMDATIPAIKAALHRGRRRLRELAQEPDDSPLPALAERERALLAAYVDRFNARDFDAVRDMLADDVRLEVVSRRRFSGRNEVGSYFHNYGRQTDWTLAPGLVDGRPAALVRDAANPSAAPTYFVLLQWADVGIVSIRDFRYARYAIEGAEVIEVDVPKTTGEEPA
jgi:RNA polymerase sigma-70 factor, ECF subfamily